ncbi:hypothetical protein ACO0LC_10095 [Undibacterium sp. JH2W]|uniref:hypothetical protein n=1 Tax=Undibacterium sp. JH2W TaxID=3413037 RepID=UPI003BF202F2
MTLYVIKFYPIENAYLIDPAPPAFEKDRFRWKLVNGDQIVVLWDRDVKEAELAFHSHPTLSNTTRLSPIEGYEDEAFIPVQDCVKLTIKMVNPDAQWGFDFSCKIEGKQYIVDPEIQIGTSGTAG